tara:strand:- start:429 stop:1379 length:951 start_codon:yes stop_codon:yes gene_type:complete
VEYKNIKPILIIAFNRPKKISKIFSTLKKYKNLEIFVSIDGPRNQDDFSKILKVESIINKLLPNNSLVVKKHDQNLGCSLHCTSAINWFFSNVEMGIIIEDDIDINNEFLVFCSRNLEVYKNQNLIFGISGSPYISILNNNKESFFLSNYPNIWGWATWRNRWQGYSLQMNSTSFWERFINIWKCHENVLIVIYWLMVIELFRTSKVDGWDHQLYYLMWKKKSYFLIPEKSQTKNIGFDSEGTYMINKPDWYENIVIQKKHLNLINVNGLYKSTVYDKICEKNIYKINFLNISKLFLKLVFYRPKIKNYEVVKHYY